MSAARLAVVPVALALALTGCTAHTTTSAPTPTITSTVTTTRSAAANPTVSAPSTVAPLAPGVKPPAGERDGVCPYIRSGTGSVGNEGKGSVADIEGDHVYRTTVLHRLHPVGCRFYFYSSPYEALADIQPHTYSSAAAAHNAMVLLARTGTDELGVPDVAPKQAPGVQGILFRTRFFGEDGKGDWAFVFVAGRVLVLVRTQRDDASGSGIALNLGRAVVDKF